LLKREATVAKYATVQNEGDRQVERLLECYSLDVIISVGYRVKSLRGTEYGASDWTPGPSRLDTLDAINWTFASQRLDSKIKL
jgi:hypothetical protein